MKKLLLSLSLAVICFAEAEGAAVYPTNYHMLSAETITNMLKGLSNSLVNQIVVGTNGFFDTNYVNELIASNLNVYSNAFIHNLNPGQWVGVGPDSQLINTNLGTATSNWILQADGISYDWGNDGSALTNVTAEHLSDSLTNFIHLTSADSANHYYFTLATNSLTSQTNTYQLTESLNPTLIDYGGYATSGFPLISFLSTNTVTRVEQGNALVSAIMFVDGIEGIDTLTLHPVLYAWFPGDTITALGTGAVTQLPDTVLGTNYINIPIPIAASTNLPAGTKLIVKFIADTVTSSPEFHIRGGGAAKSFLALNTSSLPLALPGNDGWMLTSSNGVYTFTRNGEALTNITAEFLSTTLSNALVSLIQAAQTNIAASNVYSGGQLRDGTVEINAQHDGWMLTSSNGFRLWGINGTELTNVTANFITTSLSNTIFAMITNNAITPTILQYFFTTNILYVSNAYITNLIANKATITNVTIIGGISYGTNLWANAPTGTLPMHLTRQRAIVYTPYSVTGLTSLSNASAEPVLLAISNGASTNVLATFVGMTSGAFTNQYTHSNNTTAKIWFEYDPSGPDSNFVFRLMK